MLLFLLQLGLVSPSSVGMEAQPDEPQPWAQRSNGAPDHRLRGLDYGGQAVTYTLAAPGHVAPNRRGGHACMAVLAVQLDAAGKLADLHKSRSEIASRLQQLPQSAHAYLLRIPSQMGCKL